MKNTMKAVGALSLGLAAMTSHAVAEDESLWALYEPACNINGVGEKPCRCSMEEIIGVHGEKAARFVALGMLMRDQEADVIRIEIGDDKAFAASDLFDRSINMACSSSRLAKVSGEWSSETGSSRAVESAAIAQAYEPKSDGNRPKDPIFHLDGTVPIIDFRNKPEGGYVDVIATLNETAMANARSTDMSNFIGLYRVVNFDGGVDTNGDGIADISPGDEGYANAVQGYVTVSKKMIDLRAGGNVQKLGEVWLEGGAIYVPYVRFQMKKSGGGLMGALGMGRMDRESMEKQMRGQTTSVPNIYFPFGAANPKGVEHIKLLGDDQFGFEGKARAGGTEFDDILIEVTPL